MSDVGRPPRTAAEAVRAEETGHPLRYLFFWGHREAKRLGSMVRRFDEAVWAAHRYEIVVRGNIAKFGRHPELREFLLGTRCRVLVEASPLDRVWGIGLAASDERAASAATWQGSNLLGFALMDARDALSAATGTPDADHRPR